jgi:hypothetical protein
MAVGLDQASRIASPLSMVRITAALIAMIIWEFARTV